MAQARQIPLVGQIAQAGTDDQKVYLVTYMENHQAFCQGEFVGVQGRVNLRNQWERLTAALNNVPYGASKTVEQWQTVSLIDFLIGIYFVFMLISFFYLLF